VGVQQGTHSSRAEGQGAAEEWVKVMGHHSTTKAMDQCGAKAECSAETLESLGLHINSINRSTSHIMRTNRCCSSSSTNRPSNRTNKVGLVFTCVGTAIARIYLASALLSANNVIYVKKGTIFVYAAEAERQVLNDGVALLRIRIAHRILGQNFNSSMQILTIRMLMQISVHNLILGQVLMRCRVVLNPLY
jgi:hypothetical protein